MDSLEDARRTLSHEAAAEAEAYLLDGGPKPKQGISPEQIEAIWQRRRRILSQEQAGTLLMAALKGWKLARREEAKREEGWAWWGPWLLFAVVMVAAGLWGWFGN